MRHCLYTRTGAPFTRRPKIRHDVKPTAMSQKNAPAGVKRLHSQNQSRCDIRLGWRSQFTHIAVKHTQRYSKVLTRLRGRAARYALCLCRLALSVLCRNVFGKRSRLLCKKRQNIELCVSSIGGRRTRGTCRGPREFSWDGKCWKFRSIRRFCLSVG